MQQKYTLDVFGDKSANISTCFPKTQKQKQNKVSSKKPFTRCKPQIKASRNIYVLLAFILYRRACFQLTSFFRACEVNVKS